MGNMLTKEAILDCYFKENNNFEIMRPFIEKYCFYFQNEKIQPENLNCDFTADLSGTTSNRMHSDVSSTISSSLSMYSALTRMTIDKTILTDIMNNRKKYFIFLELEDEDPEDKQWHYVDDDENLYGPFSSREMNERFMLTVLSDSTKIKKKFDDDYYPLKVLIKRYYKRVLCEKLNLEKGPRKLSKRTLDFRNGEKILRRGVVPKKERYEPRGRIDRVRSDNVRPDIGLFGNLDDILPTRQRAQTSTSRI